VQSFNTITNVLSCLRYLIAETGDALSGGAVDWNKGGEEQRRALSKWGDARNRGDEGKI